MYHIIINPASRSGHGEKIWNEVIMPMLDEQQIPYQAYFSQKAGDVAKLAHNIVSLHTANISAAHIPAAEASLADTYCSIIIVGGDGTVNEALQGIPIGAPVEIGYIPTGSSNDLARDLGISKNPRTALTKILNAHHSKNSIVKMDRGIVKAGGQTRSFAVSCGLGFDAAVCAEANSSKIKKVLNKMKLGKLTYLGIALKQLFAAKKVACDLYLDDATQPIHIEKYFFAAFMIHRYEGGGFQFCPTADYTDGILDLCVIGGIPKLIILLALPTAFFGKHYLLAGVEHYCAGKVRIETSAPLFTHTDGEAHQKENILEISCIRQDIRFLR